MNSGTYENMEKMYRFQRYFYDVTRKYYLLGRDRLICQMNPQPGEQVLEIGCGTGRNLSILAKRFPETNFYGLDASKTMLEAAEFKKKKHNLNNLSLKLALAGEFSYSRTFDLNKQFDTIYFSYSLSMIPTWKNAIARALDNLKNNQSLFIVDFFDQRDLPKPVAGLLQLWLRQFHVKYPEELIPHLEVLQSKGLGRSIVTPIFGSYAFIAEFQKGEN